mgnify:FL=1
MSLYKSFCDFGIHFKNHSIKMQNKYLQDIFYMFSFYYITDIQNKDEIIQVQNESKIMIIDEYQDTDTNKYFFACFDYKIIIYQNQETLNEFLSKHQDYDKYFLKRNPITGLKHDDDIFMYEINNFCEKFGIFNSNLQMFWRLIYRCISGFLIKKSYKNHQIKNHKNSNKKFLEGQEKIESIDRFIILREIGRGSLASVDLVYYIKREELFALKIPYSSLESIERERQNYLNIEYPFIVKYFGYIESSGRKCLLFEFVDGKTLDEYEVNSLTNNEKVNIIWELLNTVQHIHSLGYICRDIHFKNIMINENKDAIFIDFDRVIKFDEQKALDFFQIFLPELDNEGKFDYKSDVFLIGCLIFFVLTGKKLDLKCQQKNDEEFIFDLSYYQLRKEEEMLLKSCFRFNKCKRPSINQLISTFKDNFLSNMH